MLSKKMAFSLMSLITILALGFIASPAFALKVTPKLADDKHDDVSAAKDHQVLVSTLMVKFAFDQPVEQLADNATAFVVVGDAGVGLATTDPVAFNAANTEATVTLAPTGTDVVVDKSATVHMLAEKFTSLTTGEKNPRASITLNYVMAEPARNDEGDLVNVAATTGADEMVADPKVVSITRAVPVSLPRASSFVEKTVTGPFQVKIVLTEMPNGGLHSDKAADRIAALNISGGTVTNVAIGVEFARVETSGSEMPPPIEGDYKNTEDPPALDIAEVPMTTGRDMKYYPYLATIAPDGSKDKVIISVKDFKDMVAPRGEGTSAIKAGMYEYPGDKAATNGRDKLEVTVAKDPAKAKEAGLKVAIPNDIIVPAGGYLILGRNDGAGDDNHEKRTDSTQIIYPGDPTVTPILVGDRQPNQRKYNLIKADLPNLETQLGNGVTIDVMSTGLVISEIMWGSDASLATPSHNQWIELYNAGAEYKTKDAALIFYAPNDAVPAKTAAVAATATTAAVPAGLPTGVSDRVGTITDAGAYWSTAGKGQSGRTGQGETAGELIAVVPTQAVISMYRVMTKDASGMMPMGNTPAAWMQSTPPAVNFNTAAIGVRVGSPGAARLVTAAELAAAAAATKAQTDAAAKAIADAAAKAASTGTMPTMGRIYISEIMFAGGGVLPQWIEIANGSTEQVNLSGWTLTIENATADADVSVGAMAKFTIPNGTMIDMRGQNNTPSTLLVVTEQGRNNVDATGQVLNLWTDQQTELILLDVTKRKYSLLSDMAFQITLAPPVPIVVPAAATPAPTTAAEIAAKRTADAAKKVADTKAAQARKKATDVVGNLGADGMATWTLPMNMEGEGRSSIIRKHIQVSGGVAEPEDGMMMKNWRLASDTSFAQPTHIKVRSYYGSPDDDGTPGFRAGGALPVELSHFRPARDKATGQVMITWSTQSELNNAGFFIKRSQQKDGEFKVINATMIAGAGTTSEKQFYTYTDTTAQPNVVYYYQIEDVSLDGQRQTLTRGIRLKGHVGAAGKATTLWGELKASHE